MIKEIASQHVPEFEKSFKKLVGKAIKLGLEAPSYIVIGTKMVETDVVICGIKLQKEMTILDIKDVNVVISGWKVVSIVTNANPSETVKNTNMLMNGAIYSSNEELPKFCYEKSPKLCEHCKRLVSRKMSFILRNVETNEYIQVGSTCVKDFTLDRNAVGIVNYIEKWFDVCKWAFINGSGCSAQYFKVIDLLPIAIYVIDKFGWVSSAKSMENNSDSSSTTMRCLFDVGLPVEIEKSMFDKAGKILEFYHEKMSELESKTTINEFELNLIKSVNFDYLEDTRKNFGLLCYAVKQYNDVANAVEGLEYIGEIDERREFTGVILSKKEIFSMYGSAILMIVNCDGKLVKIFTSSGTKTGVKIWKMMVDDAITFVGTIKKHEEFNKNKYTEVKRVDLK